jgi:hypothetical protein
MPTRTVFLNAQTMEPVYAPDSPIPGRKWYTVRFLPDESHFTDDELINLSIQRLRTGAYHVEDQPLAQLRGMHISYPVMDSPRLSGVEVAIASARNWLEELLDGRAIIDLEYIFAFANRPAPLRARYINI